MPFKYLNGILKASQACRKQVKNEGFEQFEQFQTVKLSKGSLQNEKIAYLGDTSQSWEGGSVTIHIS